MSLIAELKRRNVVRVGAAYVVIGWVIAQVAEFAFSNFGAPDWALKAVVVVLMLGLPLALFFAWAFEMTPEGVKREKDVDRNQSITATTGRKLDRVIIGVLALALGWFVWDKFSTPLPAETPVETVSASTMGSSVAVLPFVAMSTGPDDEYFADGLTEEILNSLAQLPELLVTSRTSAFSFKGTELAVQEIAQALGVAHVVEGSVRRSGDRLRVTAQLIRANDDTHLWSENYDSTSTDAIEVQEDIAEQIAVAMDIVLDEDKRKAMRDVGLRDPEAFTLYQKGTEVFELAHGQIDTLDGLRQANAYYDKVIERVPGFAQAYLDRSDLAQHLLLDAATGRDTGDYSQEDIAEVREKALKDHETAASVARSPELRALIELDSTYMSLNWRGLHSRMQKVLANPGCKHGNTTSWLANVLGYAAASVDRANLLITCDPLRTLSWFDLARAKLWSGDKAGALLSAKEGSKAAPGAWLDLELVRILVANDLHDEALHTIDTHIEDNDSSWVLRALVAAHSGDDAGFSDALEKYRETTTNFDLFWMISMYAWGGQLDKANETAAELDRHPYGSIALLNIVQWCACGAPWDLKATPVIAARIAEGNIPWPPKSVIEFPLKTW
jgi:TolB-like protein